jgi:hypothetical protein
MELRFPKAITEVQNLPVLPIVSTHQVTSQGITFDEDNAVGSMMEALSLFTVLAAQQ